ncbi:TetR family transcriptional regulator [Rhodococcus sp. D2-41]|nr:TetR family transcriptional regulator [Rhodococcus sp. D2-41]
MELFAQQGYAGTTVEEIAARAEVSHTTFFRYFQSKEQVVIADDLDDQRTAALAAIPPGLGHFDLIRHLITTHYRIAVADEWASSTRRQQLIHDEPLLRTAYQLESDRAISAITDFFAAYTGLRVDDLRLRVFIAAVSGVVFHIADTIVDPTDERNLSTLLEAVDLLESGLPL